MCLLRVTRLKKSDPDLAHLLYLVITCSGHLSGLLLAYKSTHLGSTFLCLRPAFLVFKPKSLVYLNQNFTITVPHEFWLRRERHRTESPMFFAHTKSKSFADTKHHCIEELVWMACPWKPKDHSKSLSVELRTCTFWLIFLYPVKYAFS